MENWFEREQAIREVERDMRRIWNRRMTIIFLAIFIYAPSAAYIDETRGHENLPFWPAILAGLGVLTFMLMLVWLATVMVLDKRPSALVRKKIEAKRASPA